MGANESKAKASDEAYCALLDAKEESESQMDYEHYDNLEDSIEAEESILDMESRNNRDLRLNGCSFDEYEAEVIYYKAKALKDNDQYQEAMDQFQLLLDMDQLHSTESTSKMKFKSLKQLIKMKINQEEYQQAATLFRHLLDYISINDTWKSDYTIKSVEKLLDRVFSLAPSNRVDSDEKERLLAFTKIVHLVAINMFYPFGQSGGCCPNENLWLHAHVKYSHFLFRLEEEQRLKELVQNLSCLREESTSVSITAYRIPSGVLVDFMELLLFRLQKYETLLCIDPSQDNRIKSFIQRYEEKKIAIGSMLSNSMYEMGSIHQYAGELYTASSTFQKACSSLIEACKCWKLLNDSSAHVHCVKLLHVVKMLDGSTPALGEILGDIGSSEELSAITKVFDAFQSDDIEVFEKYMHEVEKDCFVIKQSIIEIHTKLQEMILLKELPETSRVKLSGLSSKLNDLALTTITSLVLNLIAEKKLQGQVINDQYFGLFVKIPIPMSYVADSIHIVPLNGGIQTETVRNNPELSTSYYNDDGFQANIQAHEVRQWPNLNEDCTVDRASALTKGITNIILEARTKYPHFARHFDITSLGFAELGRQLMRFLHQQVKFKSRNVSSFIDIGYHYTQPTCAASIRSTGLRCSRNGNFGPGIYTGNNCKAFANRGSVGLIVLRIQGKTTSAVFDEHAYRTNYRKESVNTVLGNKNKDGTDDKEEVVLQSSSQCVPIIIFDAPRDNPFGEGCLDYIHKSLQRMIDSFLNTRPSVAYPNTAVDESLNNFKAAQTNRNQMQLLYIYNAPDHLADSSPIDEIGSLPICKYDYKHECPICLDKLGSNTSILRSLPCTCIHIFHHDCIRKSLKVSPRCPTCQAWVRKPQGKSPGGTMRITIIPDKCSGYLEDTIVIHYQINSGYQKQYHSNPFAYHYGKDVKAYLPNNDDGKKLLKRLKYAFEHGLTFTVGTSLTTGLHNQCTWASIHHKTSLSGGTGRHGYPDVSYFLNCNEELDGLGVPPANDLPSDQGTANFFTMSIKNVLSNVWGSIANIC
ncbi:hypothetical protein CTEN210_06429 [Chaetoceros tenuissimus]|uniref:RING-type E3 ubiquitin transferase n=1 Tax=Chaetoceros tenuissimus TaxID=426638 RepID=A0AAD3H4Q1_9STRA|nr:hypothetical protein CTEN210_06429 [Chaetoceros tenuissimus]